jgi:hypothetical protein
MSLATFLRSFRAYPPRRRKRLIASATGRWLPEGKRTMAKVEVSKVEEQLNQRVLFNVCVNAVKGRMEFPIGIQELGSASLDEAALASLDPPFRRGSRGVGSTSAHGGDAQSLTCAAWRRRHPQPMEPKP